jgi:hypothetical protein
LRCWAIEVKEVGKRNQLTDAQVTWHGAWLGQVAIVETVEEALQAVGRADIEQADTPEGTDRTDPASDMWLEIDSTWIHPQPAIAIVPKPAAAETDPVKLGLVPPASPFKPFVLRGSWRNVNAPMERKAPYANIAYEVGDMLRIPYGQQPYRVEAVGMVGTRHTVTCNIGTSAPNMLTVFTDQCAPVSKPESVTKTVELKEAS